MDLRAVRWMDEERDIGKIGRWQIAMVGDRTRRCEGLYFAGLNELPHDDRQKIPAAPYSFVAELKCIGFCSRVFDIDRIDRIVSGIKRVRVGRKTVKDIFYCRIRKSGVNDKRHRVAKFWVATCREKYSEREDEAQCEYVFLHYNFFLRKKFGMILIPGFSFITR